MGINYPAQLAGVIAAGGDYADVPPGAQSGGRASIYEGFPAVTSLPQNAGGLKPDRLDFNGLFNILSQHVYWSQSGGLHNWSSSLDYALPAMVVGSDGHLYLALLPSGPGTSSGGVTVGAKNPTSETGYWTDLEDLYASPEMSGMISGSARGLRISATGGSSAVSVVADEVVVKNSSGAALLLSGVSLSASTAVSGLGGLDTGIIAPDTWYAVHIVAKADGTKGIVLSLSSTSPSLPSTYTYSARIGWVRTDGTANRRPRAFLQKGRRAQWIVGAGTNVTALPSLAGGTAGDITTPTYVAVSVSGAVPPTAVAISVGLFNNTALGCAMVAPNPNYGAYITQASPPPITQYPAGAAGEAVAISSMVLESANIYWASNAPATNLFCLGWEE